MAYWVCMAHSSCLLQRECHFRWFALAKTHILAIHQSNKAVILVSWVFSSAVWLFPFSVSGRLPALLMNVPVLMSCTVWTERVWNVQLVLSIKKWTFLVWYNWSDIFAGHWKIWHQSSNSTIFLNEIMLLTSFQFWKKIPIITLSVLGQAFVLLFIRLFIKIFKPHPWFHSEILGLMPIYSLIHHSPSFRCFIFQL